MAHSKIVPIFKSKKAQLKAKGTWHIVFNKKKMKIFFS
jgi:hypothetical protein